VPDDAWLDEESRLKKLLRDHAPPDEPPRPPPCEDPRDWQLAPVQSPKQNRAIFNQGSPFSRHGAAGRTEI
jgi:hypothetical protein